MAAYRDSSALKLLIASPLYQVLKATPILSACMRLEAAINDKKKPYIEKVEAFISLMERILSCFVVSCDFSAEGITPLFQFIQRHALHLLLDGDWGQNQAARSHMTFILSRFKGEVTIIKKLDPFVRDGIEYLITLSSNPWGDPILTKILYNEPCSDEEVLFLCRAEMGMVLVMRLEKMAEARCETQAIQLIRVCLQCFCHPDNASYFEQYKEDILYIREIYLILLVKKKENNSFVEEVRKMDLREGYEFVQRSLKNERTVRLKKSRSQMVELVANSVLMRAMFQPVVDETLLCNMIEEWFNLCQEAQKFRLLNQMGFNAVSSHHIYLLCKVLVRKYGGSEKKLCVELYIRALTVNLNELESLKLNNQHENVRNSETQMSQGFLSLADYLNEDVMTCRECVLTAFSLTPTRTCYNRLKDLARASGKLESANGRDDNCENNQSSMNCERHVFQDHMKIDTGQAEEQEQFPIHISDAQVIGVSQRLCDDLSTVISKARYHVLNWKLDWSELSSRCESYLTSDKDIRSTEKELLYLKIDYDQFKDWPRDSEYVTGIEKGFEDCAEDDNHDPCDVEKIQAVKTSTSDDSHDSNTEESIKEINDNNRALQESLVIIESNSKSVLKQTKRKYLQTLPEIESSTQNSHENNSLKSGDFLNHLNCPKKKPKIDKVKAKNLTNKVVPKNNLKRTTLPVPLVFAQDMLDIASIEEDAKISPVLQTPKRIAPVFSQPKTNPDNYCIAENDVSLRSLSSLDSPSKLSSPSVLKSLRMYRPKKSSLDSISNVPDYESESDDDFLGLNTLKKRIGDMRKEVKKWREEEWKKWRKEEFKRVQQKPVDYITIDCDSDPEVINLVDDEEEEVNNMNKINLTNCNKKSSAFDITQHLEKSISNAMQTNSILKNHFGDKKKHMNDFASTLGLKSLDMIRPATSETTVQVVQLSNTARSLVTSPSNTVPATTVVYTMPQQTSSINRSQMSNTSVIYTMPQQTTSSLQGSNVNIISNPIVIYSTSQQQMPSTSVQVQSTLITDQNPPKLSATSSVTHPTRVATATSSHSVSPSVTTTNFATPVRNYFTTSQRQNFSQSSIFLSGQNTERTMLNPSNNSPSILNPRRRTPSPRDTVAENSNVPIGVIRVERVSLVTSESNQPVPNLSPIKTHVGRQQTTSNRHIYMRGGVSKSTTVASSQAQPTITSPTKLTSPSSSLNNATNTSNRSMPVTAHIQRVGYPRESETSSTAQTSTSIQVKYIFKDGILTPTVREQTLGSDADTSDVPVVLNAEQIQQLSKSCLRKEKLSNQQDDHNSSQGSSLPKFQQAFGRPMYQSGSSSSNSSLTSNNESSQLNFPQQMQSQSVSIDSVPSPSICTVLSKAVQTSNKDSEMTGKNVGQTNPTSEQSNHRKIPSSNNTSSSSTQPLAVSTTSQTEDQLTSDSTPTKNRQTASERTGSLPQTPLKIYTCKVPVTLASSNLLQSKTRAVLKTTVSPEKVSQTQTGSKDTVIRSSMSALIAAALQPQLRSIPSISSTVSPVQTQVQLKSPPEQEKKKTEQTQISPKGSPLKSYKKMSPVQNQAVSRYTKSMIQVSAAGNSQNSSSTSVVTIPIRTVLATSAAPTTGSPSQLGSERTEALVSPSPSDDTSGSSFIDQQLKEFESVFNKVKKTSQMKERTNSTTVQIQQHLNLGQQILLAQPSSSASVEFSNNTSSNQTTLFQSTSTSTIHDLQGERVSLTFVSQPTSGATNTLIAGTSQKITSTTPVVVVQSCSKPVTSPALSVTSQNSTSPAPSSTSGKITNAVVAAKQNNKSSSKTKTATKAAPTTTLKVSTLPKPQQKPQEDEQTTQRIYAILDKYAEQLRNSPELKNKPAPRRRSNPPTNPSQNSKRKKSSHNKSKLPSQQVSCSSSGLDMSPGSEDLRTIGSEDSSNGVSQLSQSLNSPQSAHNDPSTPTGGDVSSETSESLDSRDTRTQSRVVLTEPSTGQSRTVIVQDSMSNQVLNVDASKLLSGKPVVVGSQTLVPQLVLPGGVPKMQFLSTPADGRPLVVTKVPKMYRVHQVTMPRGAFLGTGTVVLRQMCNTPTVKPIKMPTAGVTTQNMSNVIPTGNRSLTLTHDSTFEPDETININLDNAILLNTPTPSISFVRGLPSSSYQNQDSSTSGTSTTVSATASVSKTTVTYSSSDLNVTSLSMCSPINAIPTSSCQETKPLTAASSDNLTCITIDDDDIEYTNTDHRNVVAREVPTLVLSQSSNTDKRWRQSESTKTTPTSIKKEDTSQDFFQSSVKTMMAHRSQPSLCKQTRFVDNKKVSEKCGGLEKHPTVLKKENETTESVLEEPELCDDDSASSDSASSGRVKTGRQEKGHLIQVPETGEGISPPWQYNVTKIDCIVKTEPSNAALKQEDVETATFHISDPQGNSNKRKLNNVENTIFQMAFKRSKIALKEQQQGVILERDLRLQKSLSEECEDLGVDEPSTSDLFPEAELLLDPDHSSRDSQLELPNETFTQAINSSSSCDSGAVSPMLPVGRRPVTYRSSQRNQSLSKNSKFVPIYNSLYQFSEESPAATISTSRDGSPDSHVNYRIKGGKFGSNSGSNSPYMNKTMDKKESSPLLHQKTYNRDTLKPNSPEASTPINGGSTESPGNEDRLNSCVSEDSQCVQKQSEDKDMEVVDTTTDSDSNIECLNVPCRETSPVSKVFHSNPTSSLPFTYSGNRSSHKGLKPKGHIKQDMWKSLLKGSDIKDDIDSDMSDADQLRVSDKRSTSTEDDVQSESESQAKNGLGTESEDALSNNDRVMRSSKKSKKRTGSQLKSASKSKGIRRTEPQAVENFFSDMPSSTGVYKFPSTHQHDLSSRRSSLRGHSKGDCACCNNPDKQKSTVLVKTEKFISTETPATICVSKKKLHSKSTVKSSHITKKR